MDFFTAFPSFVKQAPDARALGKSTQLIIEGMPLSTPPIAQEYFEPGVNTKLRRRNKPKVDFTLPSDMPEYPLGFVPTNKTPGANGEPPSIVVRPELVPADLMDVFAKIAAQEKQDVRLPTMDAGSLVVREYEQALRQGKEEAKAESMLRRGFTEPEVGQAMAIVRQEEAVAEARLAPRSIPTEEAIAEAFGVAVPPSRVAAPPSRPINVRLPMMAPRGREFITDLPSLREGIVGRPNLMPAPARLLSLPPSEKEPSKKVNPFFFSKRKGDGE